MVIPVPVNIAIFALFGLAYGWILHQACLKNVYHVSGVALLDRGVLVWLIGLFAGITLLPALYLGFGFHEFAASPVGQQLTRRLQLLARSELTYACLYGLLTVATVQQRLNPALHRLSSRPDYFLLSTRRSPTIPLSYDGKIRYPDFSTPGCVRRPPIVVFDICAFLLLTLLGIRAAPIASHHSRHLHYLLPPDSPHLS